MVKLILITHGNLGQTLLETAKDICCFKGQDVLVFSVSGKVNLEELEQKIKAICDEGETLILVDTFGGTACNIALKCAAENEKSFVVCGLNLNMLLTASNNNGKLNLKELCEKVILDGKRAIFEATESFRK
ncbi:MAG: hypothetical protein K6E94_01100 [Elusimicrobiaceae bacterium]|nr:hypothetical protein [Elusimicrobiaceae bacterium]